MPPVPEGFKLYACYKFSGCPIDGYAMMLEKSPEDALAKLTSDPFVMADLSDIIDLSDTLTFEQMTYKIWRCMTKAERTVWKRFWNFQGIVSFGCIECGYPTGYGTAGCPSCHPSMEKEIESDASST